MGKIHTRMMPLALAVALTACGGGGGGSASSGNGSGSGSAQLVTSTTLSGVAVDGYLQNAKVCLDLNDNLVCDGGEPSVTTGANGSYSLTAPSLEAANSHRVIVEAVAGTTIDADAPSAPITQGYVLVAPIGQHAVVSPISTLLHHYQQREPGLSLAQAQQRLRQAFALSADVSLQADFAASGASAEQQYLHNIARVVARQLATGLAGVETALGRSLAAGERQQAVAVVLRQALDYSASVAATLTEGKAPGAVMLPGLDVSNIAGQLAAAALTSSVVSDPLAAMAGGMSAPDASWNGSQMMAAYNTHVVKSISTTSTPYVDADWTEHLFDSNSGDFILAQEYAQTVLKDGRWTTLTGTERCRYMTASNGLQVSCGDGWQGELSLREFALAGTGIDASLRYGYGAWTADAWDVASERQFAAGAKGYLTNFRQTVDQYWLSMPVSSGTQSFASLEDAMAAMTTAGGQRFFLLGLRASFDSVAGSQGDISLFAEGGLELPLKGQWQRKMLGQETVIEFTLPAEYLRRAWLNAQQRIGWSVHTPAGEGPNVRLYIGEMAGTVHHGAWLNAKAMADLKAARATAN